MKKLIKKVRAAFWLKLVKKLRHKAVYPFIYSSYWHYRFGKASIENSEHRNYFSAVPNQGAGIGHQLSNWIAGYWFAQYFDLQFAHSSFSNNSWEYFLGLGEDEMTVNELIKIHGYKRVKLPLFDEGNEREVRQIKNIIKSYICQKVVFIAEQDQFYFNQFGVIKQLKEKFYRARARKEDKTFYSPDNFNIAVHVRRGDIVAGQTNHNPNLAMRWQNNEYFENVLSEALFNVKTDKPVVIYLFSQGKQEDFAGFNKFKNVQYCLDVDAQSSFLHMVKADLLITSKSSFSYKPALFNNGIKICPKDFWHGYPEEKDWILTSVEGILDTSKFAMQND